MTTQQIRTKFSKFVRTCGLGAVLLIVLIGTASAGVVGAEGDIYVISHALGDYPFFSPAVLQYDGETGDFVGTFAMAVWGNFMGMAWGPNGNLFLTLMMSTGNWNVSEYDGETGEFINTHVSYEVGDASIAKGLTFGPDGDLYVGNWWIGNVHRYDGITFEHKANTPVGETGTPNGMLFNADGELLVISGGWQEVRRYQVDDDGIQIDGVFASTTGSIQAQDMTFGPNGNLFVAMGSAGGVFEYDGLTGDPIGEFVPFDAELRVNGLGFDNFDRLLVSAIFPLSRVDAYDAVTGAPLGPFLTDGLGGSDSIPTILSIKPGDDPVPVFVSSFSIEPAQGKVSIRWELSEDSDASDFELRGEWRGETWDLSFAEVGLGLFEASDVSENLRNGGIFTYTLFSTVDGSEPQLLRSESVELEVLPFVTSLVGAYPNPFNPHTTISFTLDAAQLVHVTVHDVTGRKIAQLANGFAEKGNNELVWNGTSDLGENVASGVYFVRLQAKAFTESKRIVLIR